jgi:hypothetical protein
VAFPARAVRSRACRLSEAGGFGIWGGIAAFRGFSCTTRDVPTLTGFSTPVCAPESHIGNPLGELQSLPSNNFCIPLDDTGDAIHVMCEAGVVTTRLFSNINCTGDGARETNFCNRYCESDSDDSDSDAPPACLVQSCSAADVAAVEAATENMEGGGLIAICEAVEVLHISGCMRNCLGTDDVGEMNMVLNLCGLSVLESGVPASAPTMPPRTEVLFTQVFTELDIDAFADAAFDRQFRSDYTNTYAAAFEVSADQVEILDIKQGSVVVRAPPQPTNIHLLGLFTC